ncbi:MAG: urease accessory protein UreD [Burkholderiaceae bacterium]
MIKSHTVELAPERVLGGPAERHAPSRATLALGFANTEHTTRLIERTHFGPLRIQKPLYPEGPQICHAVIVHPPGGVVGGDEMDIGVRVGPLAHALITTPGAAKWYRANGCTSAQTVTLSIAQGASLEWLPQETIFFDSASVQLRHDVDLAVDGCYLGSEILCFGRAASGESFDRGCIEQRTTIRRGGRLIWFEQGAIVAGSALLRGPFGLSGCTVCATLIAVGAGLNPALVDAIRCSASAQPGSNHVFGVTLMKTVLVARYIGNSSALARALMCATWALVRPVLTGYDATIPRVWNT